MRSPSAKEKLRFNALIVAGRRLADEAFGAAVWTATSCCIGVNRADGYGWQYAEGPEAH